MRLGRYTWLAILGTAAMFLAAWLPLWGIVQVPLAFLMVPLFGAIVMAGGYGIVWVRSQSSVVLLDQPGSRESLSLNIPITSTEDDSLQIGMTTLNLGGGAISGFHLQDQKALVVPSRSIERMGPKVTLVYGNVTPVDVKTLNGLLPSVFDALLSSPHSNYSSSSRVRVSWLNTLVEGEASERWRKLQQSIIDMYRSLGDARLALLVGQEATLNLVRRRVRFVKRKRFTDVDQTEPQSQSDQERRFR